MIYLVTDSTAYLSREEASALGVLMVPMAYIRNGREAFQEGFAEDWLPQREEILGTYSTAQAQVSAFLYLFERIKAQGHQALCLTISSRLSGTYLNALKAAEETGECVQVVDSRTTAGAMYLLLKAARKLLDAGAGLMECFEAMKAMRGRTRTLFTIQDMEPLRRSGRLGFMRSSVSTLLNLRPLLTLSDGSVVSRALARGKQDVQRLLAQEVTGKPQEVIVQHCGGEDSAQALADRLRGQGKTVSIRRIGIVLAIHLGVPILSVAWVSPEEAAPA
ncbi:MAG: DegV family protein [Eubacteriales bacterium]|nr:DegV family protein [Eubacteriales bacterium]MDD3110609.1 DegV family protein [Eubacteriales bacterium]MDD4134350.1 DegV family protein [Eubacteriales bacterium]NLO14078.1 DegV family EDD domain-containing protein [Clostridiales bacterium]